ncbi:MAG: hypothetical protein HS108_03740 [Planctomycetes bacterium]|nr:hypothetical protein [Planctomycetota bacterium]MCL4731425.1 hypothetical protein [Planctomycetota bacterium]
MSQVACGVLPAGVLLAAGCLVLVACGAGGGNNAPAAPAPADLGGERLPGGGTGPAELPPLDLAGAPSAAHRELANLLPREALVRDSLGFGGWDAARAEVSAEPGAVTTLPAVVARYESAGYRIHKPEGADNARAELDYPQTCYFTLIRAPESAAAGAVADSLRSMLTGAAKGFAAREPVALSGSRSDKALIERFLRIDPGAERDKVYVAYVMVIGSLVLYALEIEYPPALTGPGSEQIKRVVDDQRGSRVGARLVSLVHHQLNP